MLPALNFIKLNLFECTSIHIIMVPEEEREKGPEKIFKEIIAENFPNIRKELLAQTQKAQ